MIYIAGAMGINALMVKSYIDSIPMELDESALVEGASHWQTFRHVIFPMIIPIVITVGVLSFIAAYGDFVVARVLLKIADQAHRHGRHYALPLRPFRSGFWRDHRRLGHGGHPHHPAVHPASKIRHQRLDGWVSERITRCGRSKRVARYK